MANNLDELLNFLYSYQQYLGGEEHTEPKEQLQIENYIYGLGANGKILSRDQMRGSNPISSTGDCLTDSLIYAGGIKTLKIHERLKERIIHRFGQLYGHGNTSQLMMNGHPFGSASIGYLSYDAIKMACLELETNICVFDLTDGPPHLRYFYNKGIPPNRILHIVKFSMPDPHDRKIDNTNMFVPLKRVEGTTKNVKVAHVSSHTPLYVALSDKVVSVALLKIIKDCMDDTMNDITSARITTDETDIIDLYCRLDFFEGALNKIIRQHHGVVPTLALPTLAVPTLTPSSSTSSYSNASPVGEFIPNSPASDEPIIPTGNVFDAPNDVKARLIQGLDPNKKELLSRLANVATKAVLTKRATDIIGEMGRLRLENESVDVKKKQLLQNPDPLLEQRIEAQKQNISNRFQRAQAELSSIKEGVAKLKTNTGTLKPRQKSKKFKLDIAKLRKNVANAISSQKVKKPEDNFNRFVKRLNLKAPYETPKFEVRGKPKTERRRPTKGKELKTKKYRPTPFVEGPYDPFAQSDRLNQLLPDNKYNNYNPENMYGPLGSNPTKKTYDVFGIYPNEAEPNQVINLNDYIAQGPIVAKPPPPTGPKPKPQPSLENDAKARKFRQTLIRRKARSRRVNNNSNNETSDLENYRNTLSSHPGVKAPPKDPRVKPSPEPAFNLNEIAGQQTKPVRQGFKLSDIFGRLPNITQRFSRRKPKNQVNSGQTQTNEFLNSSIATAPSEPNRPPFPVVLPNSPQSYNSAIPLSTSMAPPPPYASPNVPPPPYVAPNVPPLPYSAPNANRQPYPVVTPNLNKKVKNTNAPPPYVPPADTTNPNMKSKKTNSKSRFSFKIGNPFSRVTSLIPGFRKAPVNSGARKLLNTVVETNPSNAALPVTPNRPPFPVVINANRKAKKINSIPNSPPRYNSVVSTTLSNADLKAQINEYKKYSNMKATTNSNAQLARILNAEQQRIANTESKKKLKQIENNAALARLLQQNEYEK
jgi:hypothetical protein